MDKGSHREALRLGFLHDALDLIAIGKLNLAAC